MTARTDREPLSMGTMLRNTLVLFTGILVELKRMPPDQRDAQLDELLDALSPCWVDAAITTPTQQAAYFDQLAQLAKGH